MSANGRPPSPTASTLIDRAPRSACTIARSDGEDARALALRTADTMVTFCQGYIAHAALFGPTPVAQYLEGISALCP